MSVCPELLKALEDAHRETGMATKGADALLEILSPWDNDDKAPWRYFVPGLLIDRWESLSDDARVTAYVLGLLAADAAEDEDLDAMEEL